MKITIDTRRIQHALRRAAWRLRIRLFGRKRSPAQCCDCGDELTPDEAHYYGHTCEMCEGIRFHGLEGMERR